MTVRSQNGWPAFHTPDDGNFVRFTAGGRGWWAANSDVAVVLTEFVNRFDREVEKVVRPGETYDDWSFADRLVRGSTAVVSNHGSATAIDINATRHLLGREGTFLPTDEAALERIVNAITDDAGRPVLRWGGSYSGRKDEMHIEINADAARVRQAANKIRRALEEKLPTAEDVWSVDLIPVTKTSTAQKNPTWSPQNALGRVFDNTQETGLAVRGMVAQIGALTATVGSLAAAIRGGATLTEAQIATAAQAGARAALAELGDALAGSE